MTIPISTEARGQRGANASCDRDHADQCGVHMALAALDRVASRPGSLRFGVGWWRRTSLSVIAWWHGARLDRQLAAGINPQASAILAVRAMRITACRSRIRLAQGLLRGIRDAQDTTPAFSAAVRPQRQEVLAARMVIATLDQRLRADEPVTARGVALVRALLTEGTSPLYVPRHPGALGSQLRAAAAALEPALDGIDSSRSPSAETLTDVAASRAVFVDT
jgi:hypothetical protein